ncbi:MAG: lytic transglycosylase domain-containing protein [Alphaproteobacteria bacterium]|nr:lytic transglycosylase domain-containing protein [Alphaproteobacteria bacterium]
MNLRQIAPYRIASYKIASMGQILSVSAFLLCPFVTAQADNQFQMTQQQIDTGIKDEADTQYQRFALDDVTAILTAEDQQLYREIFKLQEDGKMQQANVKIKKIENKLLLGYVLYQRYMHPTAYRSKYVELKQWLRNYADQPGAKNIYKMARKRGNPYNLVRPHAPKVPDNLRIDSILQDRFAPVQVTKKEKLRWRNTEYNVYRTVNRHIKRERPTVALDLVMKNRAKMSGHAQALSLAKISKAYFLYGGLDDKAVQAAEMGLKVDKNGDAPALLWWLGLSEWRNGDYLKAAHHFRTLAFMKDNAQKNEKVSDYMASAAAFWASRAYMQKGFMDEMQVMLEFAADYPFSFYGQLANEILGYQIDYDWNKAGGKNHNREEFERFFSYPAAMRALALYQLGDIGRAGKEFRAIVTQLPSEVAIHYIKYMDESDLASVAFAVGKKLNRQGVRVNAALYPVPLWQPKDGFRLDPALIFGFIRQESTFKSNALSVDGATGLMQIMPATARFVARSRVKQDKLFEPEYNMSLGQRYIESLMKERYIARNLLFTTVAYNGGPGNLLKWRKKMDYRDDPLLFMETIPAYESRHFAEAVLLNYWIYADRLGRANPTRKQLAQGQWPIYQDFDNLPARDSYVINDAY